MITILNILFIIILILPLYFEFKFKKVFLKNILFVWFSTASLALLSSQITPSDWSIAIMSSLFLGWLLGFLVAFIAKVIKAIITEEKI